jgi:hypothetical protein
MSLVWILAAGVGAGLDLSSDSCGGLQALVHMQLLIALSPCSGCVPMTRNMPDGTGAG